MVSADLFLRHSAHAKTTGKSLTAESMVIDSQCYTQGHTASVRYTVLPLTWVRDDRMMRIWFINQKGYMPDNIHEHRFDF